MRGRWEGDEREMGRGEREGAKEGGRWEGEGDERERGGKVKQ